MRIGVASGARQGSAPPSVVALGWLDSTTVVEASQSGQLALYEGHGLTKIRDLGLTGLFEGII